MHVFDEFQLTGDSRLKIINGKKEWVNVESKVAELVLLIEIKDGKIVRADTCAVPTANKVERTVEFLK